MKNSTKLSAIVAGVSCAIASAAHAASTATFTETLTASGIYNGAMFTNAVLTFQGTGSLPSSGSGGIYTVSLSTDSVSGLLSNGSAFSASFIDGARVFSNTGSTYFGFTDGDGTDIADVGPTRANKNLSASFSATGVANGNEGTSFDTSGGAFVINSFSGSGTFVERLNAVSAAPEPGAWALMLGGVGALGFMLRRRRSAALSA